MSHKSGEISLSPRLVVRVRRYVREPVAVTLHDGCAQAHSVKTFFPVAANNFAFITSRIYPSKDYERIMTTQNSHA